MKTKYVNAGRIETTFPDGKDDLIIEIPGKHGARLVEFGPRHMYAHDKELNKYIPPSDSLFNFSCIFRPLLSRVKAAELTIKLPKMLLEAKENKRSTYLSLKSEDAQWNVVYDPYEAEYRFGCVDNKASFYSKMTGTKSLSRTWQADAGMFFLPSFYMKDKYVLDVLIPRLKEFVNDSKFLNNEADSSAEQ